MSGFIVGSYSSARLERSSWRKWQAAVVMSCALTGAVVPAASADAWADRRAVRLSVDASSQAVSAHIRGIRGSRCTLKVAAKKQSTTFAVTLNARGRGTIEWPVPEAAPSGKWTFSVACMKGHHTRRAKTQITLVNHGSGTGGLVKPKNEGGGKGGGGQSCAPVAVPANGGQVCFTGDPFATYGRPGEDVGQCTWYAAGRRPDLDGITTGNASEWLTEAKGKVSEGKVPVVGAIAVNTTADGGLGHVAYVAEVKNGGATLVLDEANLRNDEKVYLGIETPASEFVEYIYGGPAGNGPNSTSPPVSELPPAHETPPPTAPPTYGETTGPGPTHTWTDYSDAGGNEGQSIPDNTTVQIACKVTGFAVEDGNTWWYRIASSPWNGTYYASADAFYNEPGRTSGSLKGTPFVDPNVPNC